MSDAEQAARRNRTYKTWARQRYPSLSEAYLRSGPKLLMYWDEAYDQAVQARSEGYAAGREQAIREVVAWLRDESEKLRSEFWAEKTRLLWAADAIERAALDEVKHD